MAMTTNEEAGITYDCFLRFLARADVIPESRDRLLALLDNARRDASGTDAESRAEATFIDAAIDWVKFCVRRDNKKK